MERKIKLAVITDGTPLKEDSLASGMLRVNTRLFTALSEHITIIATTTNYAGRVKTTDIAKNLQDRCTLIALPSSLSILFKILSRLCPGVKPENIAFKLLLPRLTSKIYSSQANWIFCSCGADPFALKRGFELAKLTGLPLAIYLVDDFLEMANLSGNKQHLQVAEQELRQWLQKTDKIFVISQGLKDRLKDLYQVDSQILPLPYYPYIPIVKEKLPKEYSSLENTNPEEQQIIFVGSISHFYRDGLKQIASILDELNREHGLNLTLRLTSPNLTKVKKILGEFQCLRSQPCLSTEELDAQIATSLLCFAPYSFENKYKVCVSTSFPSKMLDYLNMGKFIIVYAPEYSTSVCYFKEHNLSEVITIEDKSKLKKTILDTVKLRPDFSHRYREVSVANHNYNYVSEVILNHLDV